MDDNNSGTYWYDTDYSIDADPINQYGYPLDIPYYWSSQSGIGWSNVDYNFPNQGKGQTQSPRLGNSDTHSGASSRLDNNNNIGNYLYQNVTLEAGAQYTISVYARAINGNYDDAVQDHQFRFAYRPPGGSDTFSSFNTMATYVDNWTFQRYSFTFTANTAGVYRVGIAPPYASNNGGRFWGAQLEKGSTATRYIYTYSTLATLKSDALPISSNTTTTYVEWTSGYPNNTSLNLSLIHI